MGAVFTELGTELLCTDDWYQLTDWNG